MRTIGQTSAIALQTSHNLICSCFAASTLLDAIVTSPVANRFEPVYMPPWILLLRLLDIVSQCNQTNDAVIECTEFFTNPYCTSKVFGGDWYTTEWTRSIVDASLDYVPHELLCALVECDIHDSAPP